MYISQRFHLFIYYTRKDVKHVDKSFIKKKGVDIGRPSDKGRDPNNNSPEEVHYEIS